MPAFDPLEYDSSEEDVTGGSPSSDEIIDNGFPYGMTGVVSMAAGFFLFVAGPAHLWFVGLFGLLLVLAAPCICLAGKKHGESPGWTQFTLLVVIFPALFVLFAGPMMMWGYGSR